LSSIARQRRPVISAAMIVGQTEIARKLAAELALPPAQRNRVGPYDADAGSSAWDALEG
jgi:hypothetical protein